MKLLSQRPIAHKAYCKIGCICTYVYHENIKLNKSIMWAFCIFVYFADATCTYALSERECENIIKKLERRIRKNEKEN